MRRAATRLGWTLSLTAALLVAVQAPASAGRGRVVFRFADPAITESSGLVLQDALFVTLNDSGNDAVLYTVDPLSGKTVDVTRFADEQVDAEALAPAGGNAVWVGDIGDNATARASVTVTRIEVDGSQDPSGADSFELTYPDGDAADAEALLCDPTDGRLYVVTKSVLGGQVLQAPEKLDPDAPNELEPISRVPGIITDGAFFPDGRHVILRDYGRGTIYTFPELELVGEFDLPAQRQGEGIAVGEDGTVFVSSEGAHQAVYRQTVPPYLQAAMGGVGGPSDKPSDPPADTEPVVAPQTPKAGRFTPVLVVLGGGGLMAMLGLVLVLRRRGPAG